ncbi:hypothetical protein ETAA8_43960 [Anatilimnocola aggregata]|uniref:Uncharacterized protein n=1 Tax=Anatilimnocola aggregata TaxID=2528021 RepID=A0A517YGD4_9BACT|nr:hypothetical protein ETAA8_43960 [Anatilimnocola aggregata]
MKKPQDLSRGRLFCIPRHYCRNSAAVTQARSLWLVWSDVAMNRAIARIQKIDSAVILPMPAGLWKGERELELSTSSDLENTIIRWRARDLVICGHSARREGERTVGKQALLDRVRRSIGLNQLCRTALLNQLQILREEPSRSPDRERRIDTSRAVLQCRKRYFFTLQRGNGRVPSTRCSLEVDQMG